LASRRAVHRAGTLGLVIAAGALLASSASAQQVVDLTYDTRVRAPAYPASGPLVVIDEGHRNFHTASGRYKPFADLMSADGFRVAASAAVFSATTLAAARILVISNARGEPPDSPAFTDAESDAVREWVRMGGSLLLIADHAPFGSAAAGLGQRFGVHMSATSTLDEQHYFVERGNRGFIVYTRESGGLADHPITSGRNAGERLEKVMTFTGQSLKGPEGSVALLRLSATARDRVAGSETGTTTAAGRAQAIAFTYGRGRVVVLGEAGMLSAQTVGPDRLPMGMNQPGIDNRQFALNVMHWLSGLLK
jgi:hypothetical protein